MKRKSNAKKSTKKKKAGKKAIKNSKPGRNKNTRGQNSKGKSKSVKPAKVRKVSKKVQNTGRKKSNPVTVSFGKKQVTRSVAERFTRDQLVRMVRKTHTGIDKTFTKSDLIGLLYGKKSETRKKKRKIVEKTNRTKRKRKSESVLPLVASKQFNSQAEITNIMRLDLTEPTFERKLEQVRQYDFALVDFYIEKEILLPRAFMIILKTRKGNEEFERANKMSPPNMAVTRENVKSETLSFMVEFQDDFLQREFETDPRIDSQTDLVNKTDSGWVFDPQNIESIYIRFLYASGSK
jgi:hypothetical protein